MTVPSATACTGVPFGAANRRPYGLGRFVDGVEPRIGEPGADARIFERRDKHQLAQAVAVLVPVGDFIALAERNGVIGLAAVVEFGTPYTPDAGR